MMVPSLYINYRLKSVAHMPAKAMTYKFLNTFIDGKLLPQLTSRICSTRQLLRFDIC
jgi:hypothetical protein